jgi:DeoR family ulaG and ulaABCDEF operon transcriptional repressor
MHATERERLIIEAMGPNGFVSYRDLESRLTASPATIRRDLSRLEEEGVIHRVRGGAKLTQRHGGKPEGAARLAGTPFSQSITEHLAQKQAIGRAAAQLCPHIGGLDLSVLTNSLHIANALLPQSGTQILLPSGTLFREQNIILAPAGEESMPRFHAPKLFMGAAAVGPQGVMQQDVILVAAERRLIDRAEQVILLVDSSKFTSSSGAIVCGLDEVDIVVTDKAVQPHTLEMLEKAGPQVIVVKA